MMNQIIPLEIVNEVDSDDDSYGMTNRVNQMIQPKEKIFDRVRVMINGNKHSTAILQSLCEIKDLVKFF